QVVLLDAGSTNLAIAQQLPAALGLTVITNAPQIAVAASLHEGTSVQLIGGRLASGGGAVGAEALAQVQRLRADVYLPGPCAVDGDTGVWAMDAEEATLKRAMVACSSRVIVAATTEKLGARGNWQIASLDEIDDLVLTTTAPPALAARFHAAGIAVHPTPP
ncbi:DeoR/GlpR family DNA-binding transcription regulator, partial [Stenotrophomonas maltophilia]|nr:DeoR/GlpR transcriptional regulator [Stenotrophomonas maltophilia]